jgi:hypothetical protein
MLLRTSLGLIAVAALAAVVLVSLQSSDNATANSLTGTMAVTGGYSHSCAITTGGALKCWGSDAAGQLGDDVALQDSTVPVDVQGLTSGVTQVALGEHHTCALNSTGGVKCWGGNVGQVGDGTTSMRTTPVDVIGLQSGVAAIEVGGAHSCALTTGGGVKCWGNNVSGRLGDGTTTNRLTPVDVVDLTTGVAAIAAGEHHTCALTSSGGVKCWGRNVEGQLGDGTTTNRSTAVDVVGLSSGVTAIAAGGRHTCAIMDTAEVKCWGRNGDGQLGDGTTTSSTTPVDVGNLNNDVTSLALGSSHTCALETDGVVECWGNNNQGQLGNAIDSGFEPYPTPEPVLGLTAANVGTGYYHSCAVRTSGVAACWGQNVDGELGDGTTVQRLTPVDVVTALGKPTPTSTPCPPEGCPTSAPTPTPTLTNTPTLTPTPCPQEGCVPGAGMSIAIDGLTDCSTSPGNSVKCRVVVGDTFTVVVSIDELISVPDIDGDTVAGYSAFYSSIYFSGVERSNRPGDQELGPSSGRYWPGCIFAVDKKFSNRALTACALGVAGDESTYTGRVSEVDFTCTPTSSSGHTLTLVHSAPLDTFLLDEAGNPIYTNSDGPYETLSVNCVYPWDSNGDGFVTIADIFLEVLHFGETPPSDAAFDVNGDGTVSVADIAAVIAHFGQPAV